MTQGLLLTIRFLDGRYHGTGDWPPAPGRLFQAIVAGAAHAGKLPPALLEALAWLETLPPPVITAPRAVRGAENIHYVPNNDLDSVMKNTPGLDVQQEQSLIRVPKPVSCMLFDDRVPLRYFWQVGAGHEARTAAICEAANNLYQLGRGYDAAWAAGDLISSADASPLLSSEDTTLYKPSERGAGGFPLPCPTPGSINSIENRFQQTLDRLQAGEKNGRPATVLVQPDKTLFKTVNYHAPHERLLFEFIQGDGRGFAARDLTTAGPLVTDIRDRVAEAIVTHSPQLAEDVERYLIGRQAGPEDAPHRVRIIPVPSIGHRDVDMDIRRLAVYIPRSCPLPGTLVSWALSRIEWSRADGSVASEMHPGGSRRMIERYERPARRWQTVTPIAISPGKPRAKTRMAGSDLLQEHGRVIHAIRRRLHHAGIDVPALSVFVRKSPGDPQGAHAADFARGTRFPSSSLWHAEIEFAEPVQGPLLIGDGRFLGLGLMRPEPRTPGISALAITQGLAEYPDPLGIVRAARRATMARAQEVVGQRQSLPLYVTGHGPDGPARSSDGKHRHVHICADLKRSRLLWIAPPELRDEDGRFPSDIQDGHDLVEKALAGMREILASYSGKLSMAPASIDAETDPLFVPSRVWQTVTPYRVCRPWSGKGLTPRELVRDDVRAEIARLQLPRPEDIQVLNILPNPRERHAVHAELRIIFRNMQRGPLLLGQSSHQGGGLFEAVAIPET